VWHDGEVAAGPPVDVIYHHSGGFRKNFNYTWIVFGNLPDHAPAARAYWLVFRYDGSGLPPTEMIPKLTERVRALALEARRRGFPLAGIQLDIDSPSRSLPEYAAFLRQVKAGLRRPVEQLRHALWSHPQTQENGDVSGRYGEVFNRSIYWEVTTGWDRKLLLEAEVPIEALRAFIDQYPKAPQLGLVRYSLAVRLARENQFDESARIFDSLGVAYRARRMRRLAFLYGEAYRADAPGTEVLEAKFVLAQFLSDNSERVFFNDRLWDQLQSYFFYGAKDTRFTAPERLRQAALERKLKDDQEERWRAYLILREVVTEAGPTPLGRHAAELAIRCVRRINERFDRPQEIRDADIELSRWLRRSP